MQPEDWPSFCYRFTSDQINFFVGCDNSFYNRIRDREELITLNIYLLDFRWLPQNHYDEIIEMLEEENPIFQYGGEDFIALGQEI